MRYLIRFGFILIISALMINSSCSKFNTKKHFVLDDYFRSYFNFRNGSEWMYRTSTDTGTAEVVHVAGYANGKMVWDAFEQDFIQYDLISSADSVLKIRAVAEEGNIAEAVLLVKDTFFRSAARWFYSTGQFSGVTGTGDTFTYHSTFMSGSEVYNDVIELKPVKSHWYRSIAMARNVGIIRKELLSGTTFILKSYHVQ